MDTKKTKDRNVGIITFATILATLLVYFWPLVPIPPTEPAYSGVNWYGTSFTLISSIVTLVLAFKWKHKGLVERIFGMVSVGIISSFVLLIIQLHTNWNLILIISNNGRISGVDIIWPIAIMLYIAACLIDPNDSFRIVFVRTFSMIGISVLASDWFIGALIDFSVVGTSAIGGVGAKDGLNSVPFAILILVVITYYMRRN